MSGSLISAARTAIAQVIIDQVGNNGFIRAYNGAIGATGLAAVTGANTLLVQYAATGVLGVASPAGIDVTETNFANVAPNNLGGTATFVDCCTNAGVVIYRVRLPADGWLFTLPVTTGQAVALGTLTIPVGNA